MFSSLEAEQALDGAAVLDLYAGSGALALEALSRGAREALLVEVDARAAGVLRRNIAELGVDAARVSRGRVTSVLATPPSVPVDLVLIDPPFGIDDDELATVLAELAAGWLAPGARVVVERAVQDATPRWPQRLEPVRERRYGDSVVYLARHAPWPG